MTTMTNPSDTAERIHAHPFRDSTLFSVERPIGDSGDDADAMLLEVTTNGCGWLYLHDVNRGNALPAMILVLPSELRTLRDFLTSMLGDDA